MSFSIDDLVSSLNSNHIGQEQLDLAAFKSQMAKTLIVHTQQYPTHHPSQPIGAPPPARRNSLAQPCNSPVQRAPAATFGAVHGYPDEDERMDEDMVEELLDAPLSPVLPTSPTMPSSYRAPPPVQQPAMPMPPPPHPSTHADPAASLFTTTDPFYLSLTQPRLSPAAPPAPFFSRTSAFQIDGGAGAVLVDR